MSKPRIATDDPSFIRDGSSRAVLNTDNAAYLQHKMQRSSIKNAIKMQEEIDELKQDMGTIKNLLEQILLRVK